jgi:hypothetical protein
MAHLAHLVVGRIRKVDKTAGVIVVGPIRFWVPEGLSLPEFGGGTKIMTTCEERDGKCWITACRPAGELRTNATNAAGPQRTG